jgi:hypothetical protein
VQSAKFDRGFAGSTTSPVAFPNQLTPGSFLVATASVGANTTVTFSDGVNTWTTVTSRYWANVGSVIAIGWAQNASTAALTLTATFGASGSFGAIIISEWLGVASSSPVDVFTVGANVSASTSPSDVSMTTTQNGDLVVSATISDGQDISAGSGNTLVQSNSTVTDQAMEYQVQATAGAIAMNWTLASAAQSIPISAAFKSATGSAPSVPAKPVNTTRAAVVRASTW